MPDLEKFSASQREAITHRNGPALVLAGPGSGKTTVITKRIQYMVEEYHIKPEQILVLTFTKAAALEMKNRFQILTGSKSNVYFGTFHSYFYQILQNSQKNSPYSLINEKEKERYLCEAMQLTEGQRLLSGQILSEISRLKNCVMEDMPDACPFPEIEKEVWLAGIGKYRNLCQMNCKIDFDDMAYLCRQLLLKSPKWLQYWQNRFPYLLVDEFQDSNQLQFELLRMLANPLNNLFMVGDDDQSIYGFRGAKPSILLELPEIYPDLKKIFLEKNYRCRSGICEKAHKLIIDNKKRYEKCQEAVKADQNQKDSVNIRTFRDRAQEETELLAALKGMRKEELSETAILFRTNAEAVYFQILLKKAGILCRTVGKKQSAFEHFAGKDITAYLQLALGKLTRKNLYQILNHPERKIGRECVRRESFSWEELEDFYKKEQTQRDQVKKLKMDCKRISEMSLYAAIVYIRKGIGYDRYLKTLQPEEKQIEAQLVLKSLQEQAESYQDIRCFTELIRQAEIKNKSAVLTGTACSEGVTVMTYHSAKGLEYNTVILPDLNEGFVPHKRAEKEDEIEEERRMLYVAMTRARETLHLWYCTGTKKEPETVSRFLKNIL